MKQHFLVPKWNPDLTIDKIPHEHLINLGTKALLLDVDKTLLPGKDTLLSSSVKAWVKEAKKDLEVRLLSNNPSKKRIKEVADQLNIEYTYKAGKPSRKKIRKIQENLDLTPQSIAIIGDRLFTDILVGNRLGLYTVLVQPLGINGKASKNKLVPKMEKFIASILGANNK